MNKKIIAVDLDLTVYDTGTLWFAWLINKCKGATKILDLGNWVDYDLRNYFNLPKGLNGFEFWSEPETYENCEIKKGAEEVIEELYNKGFDIVFVSYCMGCPDQIKHKIKRLKKDFPFLLPEDFHFVATKSKGLVKCDYLVDDRNTFLNQTSEDTTCIKMDTRYTQDESLQKEVIDVDSWDEILKVITDMGDL